jgi:hypothetical protein
VAQACYPGYSGGRGRRSRSSKPTEAKLARLHLKNKIKAERLLPGYKSTYHNTHTHTHINKKETVGIFFPCWWKA